MFSNLAGRRLDQSTSVGISFDGFSPIQRIGPGPRTSRLVQKVAGTDEIVGRNKIFRGVRHHPAPSISPSPPFQRAHQPQLQAVAAIFAQHADAAEISGIVRSRGWHHAGKGDRCRFVKREPPMSPDRTPEWVHHRRRSDGEVLPACPRYHRHRHRPRESSTLAGP